VQAIARHGASWRADHRRGRRNLTPEQKSYLRGKRYNLEKKTVPNEEGVNQYSEVGRQNDDQPKTHERLAEEYGVSPKTIERDGEFADAVDTLEAQVQADMRETVLKRQRHGTEAITKKQTVAAWRASSYASAAACSAAISCWTSVMRRA
jgi:hypothetical protein